MHMSQTQLLTMRCLCLLVVGVAVLVAPFCEQAAAAEPARPNIVLIYTDDQPTRGLSCNDPYFHTPNIDRLRREGVMFQNAFVTTSICAVSRASMFMGQHMVRHGINSFDAPLSAEQLRQSYAGLVSRQCRDAGETARTL